MAKQFIHPEKLANFPKLFTQVVAVEAGGAKTVYVSGQVAIDKDGNLVGKGDLGAQADQVFQNLALALEAAGARPRVSLTDLSAGHSRREPSHRALLQRVSTASRHDGDRLPERDGAGVLLLEHTVAIRPVHPCRLPCPCLHLLALFDAQTLAHRHRFEAPDVRESIFRRVGDDLDRGFLRRRLLRRFGA